jgi:probable F420-dependent oxidoreductase
LTLALEDEVAVAGLRVGLVAGADVAQIAALEALPIDSLWTGGHIASRNPSPEALMNLARLSAVTERVRIGTATLLLPLYPPAIVAKQIADLDNATQGRITLGVGVGGEYPQEFRACQVPVDERGRRADEAIPLLRRFWTEEEISHAGTYYSMADVKVHPRPVQPGGPPIIVSGRKLPAMWRAALLGDGWMPYLYSPNRYAASVETIHQIAADAGRDLSNFEWYAFVFVNIEHDGAIARENAARAIGGNYRQDMAHMIERVAVAGTAAEVTDQLQTFVDAGVKHFIFKPTAAADRNASMFQALLGEVIPALHE